MQVARVNGRSVATLNSTGGVGGVIPSPYLDDLTNVDLTGLSDGDTIVFDEASGTWIPGTSSPVDTCRWELAVIPGSPPDSLYADGDWLYICVTDALPLIESGGGPTDYLLLSGGADYMYPSS